MNQLPSDDRLMAGVDAVALAGRVCRWVQTQPGGVKPIRKPDGSPVTIGDFCSQAVVARTLHERLGTRGTPLVSEETSDFLRDGANVAVLESCIEALHCSGVWHRPDAADVLEAIDLGAGSVPEGGAAFWTLDPIDGTKGFVRNGQYAVCLALIEAGQPTIAAMGCPNLAAGVDADAETIDETGVVLAASADDPHPGVLQWSMTDPLSGCTRLLRTSVKPGMSARFARSVAPGHSNREWYDRIVSALGDATIGAQIDSQCKYALVARGTADAYMRVPVREHQQENIWDHAPGVLLVRKAGGMVTDMMGRELVFDAPKMWRTRGVVAAEARTHERIMRAVRELGLEVR